MYAYDHVSDKCEKFVDSLNFPAKFSGCNSEQGSEVLVFSPRRGTASVYKNLKPQTPCSELLQLSKHRRHFHLFIKDFPGIKLNLGLRGLRPLDPCALKYLPAPLKVPGSGSMY